MANPHKGEIAFDAGGVNYTLRFSIDAICILEESTGKGIVALSSELSDPKTMTMGLLRKVVWAGLRDHHPDIELKAAGELIAASGGLAKMIERVGQAFALAFPEGEGGEEARPLKPGQDGTGPASTANGAG